MIKLINFSHKKWLELRAQPRKLPRPKITSFREPLTKISELRLRRICEELARPRRRMKSKSPRHKRHHDRFSLYDPVTKRISELSQPRKRHTCACEACNSTTSRSSSVSVEGNKKKCFNLNKQFLFLKLLPVSERIKSLAIPKYPNNIKCGANKTKRLHRPSPSYDNLIMKDCNLRCTQRHSMRSA